MFEKIKFCLINVGSYIIMSDRKAKLLKRYAGQVKIKKEGVIREGLYIKDNEIEFNESLSSQSQESNSKQRKRVRSDSQGNQEEAEKIVIIQEDKKSKRVSKGIRKALGLKKGEDVQEFLDAVKIEGIQANELEQYLKTNKDAFTFQNKKQRKEKKKKDKEKERKIQVKLQEQAQKSSSDLEIPQQARTIYRNKDGTIREFSKQKEKEMKQQDVLNRLAEWEKGMKKQQSQQDQPIDIWDDPARRWQSKSRHPLQCPYSGYANRFDIRPGFRWDGVIRGNGFQNKYLQEANLRKFKQEQEHKDYLKNL